MRIQGDLTAFDNLKDYDGAYATERPRRWGGDGDARASLSPSGGVSGESQSRRELVLEMASRMAEGSFDGGRDWPSRGNLASGFRNQVDALVN